MLEKQILLNNRKFFYREAGEGRPLVLLHGFGEDGTVWQHQFNAFPKYRLLVPDLPGSGQSELQDAMGIDDLAKYIDHWLKAIGIEKAVLIGHSMGGYIALSFAEQFPQKLSGLGLFHSTTYADSEEKKKTGAKASALYSSTAPWLF